MYLQQNWNFEGKKSGDVIHPVSLVSGEDFCSAIYTGEKFMISI
jgi:hypothetical protein